MSDFHIPVISAVPSIKPCKPTDFSVGLQGFFAFYGDEIGHSVSGANQSFTYIIILKDTKWHLQNISMSEIAIKRRDTKVGFRDVNKSRQRKFRCNHINITDN